MKFTATLFQLIIASVFVISGSSCTVSAEKPERPTDRGRSQTHPTPQMQPGEFNALKARFEAKELPAVPQTKHPINKQLKPEFAKPTPAKLEVASPISHPHKLGVHTALTELDSKKERGEDTKTGNRKKSLPPTPSSSAGAKQAPLDSSTAAKSSEDRAKEGKPIATIASPKQMRLMAPEILSHDILVRLFNVPTIPVPEKILIPDGLLMSYKVTDPVVGTYKTLLKDNPLAVAVLDELTAEETRIHNTLGAEFESIFAAYYLFTKEGAEGKRIPFPEDKETKSMRTEIRYTRFLAAISRKIKY